MAQSSYSGRVQRIPAASFGADEPVLATRAFLLRNNLLHLLDEFCQHRINWCAGIGDSTITGGLGCVAILTGNEALYEQEFEHFWLNPGHPGNLDLLIRSSLVAGGSPEMAVRVRVVPANYEVGDLGRPALIDETHSVTDDSGLWEHQEFFDSTDANVMNLLKSARERTAFEVIEDGEWHYPEVAMLKLQVQLLGVSGDAPSFAVLTGVTVREFA